MNNPDAGGIIIAILLFFIIAIFSIARKENNKKKPTKYILNDHHIVYDLINTLKKYPEDWMYNKETCLLVRSDGLSIYIPSNIYDIKIVSPNIDVNASSKRLIMKYFNEWNTVKTKSENTIIKKQ